MKKDYKHSTGFTLVELMVAVGLMVILIGSVVFVFAQTSTIFRQSGARMEIYQNARISIDKIEESLVAALPISDPNQHFILVNMYTNSPEVADTCPDVGAECIYNQGDALFFYGTTYIQGEPVTGYITYRMADYDRESDSYRLKVIVIPLKNIDLSDFDGDGGFNSSKYTLISDDGDPYASLDDALRATTDKPGVNADELCQYVRAMRIKYQYSDAWPSECSMPQTDKAELTNILPYQWGPNGIEEDDEAADWGDTGDNDLVFGTDDSREEQQYIRDINRRRSLKRFELSASNAGSAYPEMFTPFWFVVADPEVTILSPYCITYGDGSQPYDWSSDDIKLEPLRSYIFFDQLLNPVDEVNKVPTFRFATPIREFLFRTPDPEAENPPPDPGPRQDNTCVLLRFKVHDALWDTDGAPGYTGHTTEYARDGEHPFGAPGYEGNAIRVAGVPDDPDDMFIPDGITDYGRRHYVVKKLPSCIQITLRVVDQQRRDTRIVTKKITLPVN
ncbi:PilW family protein [Planctomycetota bacterium]